MLLSRVCRRLGERFFKVKPPRCYVYYIATCMDARSYGDSFLIDTNNSNKNSKPFNVPSVDEMQTV